MTRLRLGGALIAFIALSLSVADVRADIGHGIVGSPLVTGTTPMATSQFSADTLSSSDFLSSGDFAGEPGLNDEMLLYLSVTLNGRAVAGIVQFTYHPDDGRMQATREALDEVGLIVPRQAGRLPYLDELPGVGFVYDEPSQSIAITAPPRIVKPQVISAQKTAAIPTASSDYGALVNYRLSVGFGGDITRSGPQIGLPTADIEARLNSPFGVFTTTGLMTFSGDADSKVRFSRYDSYFTVSSPERMLTATLGDFVSSTLPWGRAVRLGGLRLSRDFSLRSDVVTNPRLSFTGLAAVPSTIDVYLGSVRAWSGKTDAGAFRIVDLPMLGPSGEAVIVVKDAEGRAQESRIPFFASRDGLRAGMMQFSFDYGRPRLEYISEQGGYGERAAGSASMRYGLTDFLTLQGQFERGPGLSNLVLGANAVVFSAAEIGMALGRSRFGERDGHLAFGTLRTHLGKADLRLSSLRTFDGYADLATALGIEALGPDADAEEIFRQYPATAQDAVSVTIRNLFCTDALNLGYIRAERNAISNEILSISYSRALGERGQLRLGGFTDMAAGGSGLSIAMNFRLGGGRWGGTSLSRDPTGAFSTSAGFGRPLERRADAWGYRANVRSGQSGRSRFDASGSYRGRFGLVGMRLASDEQGRVSGSGSIEGALVVAGGRLFATSPVRDSFAVVKLGLPDVSVSFNGQPSARTGPFGAALLPDLRGNRSNRLSISPSDLPPNATLMATAMTVVPTARSGVTLTFGQPPGHAALVVLRGADGQVLPAGTPVLLNQRSGDFVVGYDGQVWLDALAAHNRIDATTESGQCEARINLVDALDATATMKGFICR